MWCVVCYLLIWFGDQLSSVYLQSRESRQLQAAGWRAGLKVTTSLAQYGNMGGDITITQSRTANLLLLFIEMFSLVQDSI